MLAKRVEAVIHHIFTKSSFFFSIVYQFFNIFCLYDECCCQVYLTNFCLSSVPFLVSRVQIVWMLPEMS